MVRWPAALAAGLVGVVAAALAAAPVPVWGDQAPAAQAAPAVPAAAQELSAFPARTEDPARVATGKALFSANCSFCHGANAKGGETGPNLTRSHVVLDDKNGELIEPIVHSGRPAKGMPPFTLTSAQVDDIAAFLHSIPVGGNLATEVTVSSLVGNARAGNAYFNGKGGCRNCHSVTGDLARYGAKHEPRELQSLMVAGGPREMPASYFELQLYIPTGTTARITLPSGVVHEGRLTHIDEFNVSIVDPGSGETLSVPRDGTGGPPKIEIHNPLQAHLDLLRVYTDTDIHNLTAYLATLK